jgi:hypothetical protein
LAVIRVASFNCISRSEDELRCRLRTGQEESVEKIIRRYVGRAAALKAMIKKLEGKG